MTDEQLAAVNFMYFIAFVAGLAVATISIALRALNYTRHAIPMPILLPRDLFLVFGILFPFAGGFLWVILGLEDEMSSEPLWVIPAGGIAVIAVWVFVYFELFVIEGLGPLRRLRGLRRRIQARRRAKGD